MRESGIAGTRSEADVVARLIAEYSVEITARDRSPGAHCAAWLQGGSEVYIAAVPGAVHDRVVAIAAELRAAGFVPIPHIAARSFTSYTQFSAHVARLADAGVEAALVIAGDVARPAGPFACGRELVQTGLFERRGFRRIGLPCYPEPHPRIDRAKLDAELEAKLHLVRAGGMQAWLVSQFSLEAAPIIGMAQELRRRGITAPLRIGLAGPTDRRTLWKYALRCGIGASIRALGTRTDAIRDLLIRDTPSGLVQEIARHPAMPGLAIAGLHIFTFGGLRQASTWAASLADRGR